MPWSFLAHGRKLSSFIKGPWNSPVINKGYKKETVISSYQTIHVCHAIEQG